MSRSDRRGGCSHKTPRNLHPLPPCRAPSPLKGEGILWFDALTASGCERDLLSSKRISHLRFAIFDAIEQSQHRREHFVALGHAAHVFHEARHVG
jgi:hypothetical protein